MKLDIYLKAVHELQMRAYALTSVERCEVTLYHFTKNNGEPQRANRPTIIFELEEAGVESSAENFDSRYFAFYPFRNRGENDAVLARATAKLERIEREQKKNPEATGTARTLQPDAMQTTTI